MILLLGCKNVIKKENLKYIFLINMKRGGCYKEYEDGRECCNEHEEKRAL